MLPEAPVVISEGRSFPVNAVIYRCPRISVLTKPSRLHRRNAVSGKWIITVIFNWRREIQRVQEQLASRIGSDVLLSRCMARCR